MDSVGKISTQISDYTAAGHPAEALKVANRYYQNPDYASSLIFCLTAAHAAVRTKQPHVIRRRLLVRYLKLVANCPNYDKQIEARFWKMQAAVAIGQKKPNPVIALMMYGWVLDLRPVRSEAEIIRSFVRKLKQEHPGTVVRDKLTRKDLVGPRHKSEKNAKKAKKA